MNNKITSKDYEQMNGVMIDSCVCDLLLKEFVKQPERLTYDMLEDTEFLDELEEK